MLKKVKDAAGLTNYGIAKGCNDMNVKITIPGIDAYDKPTAQSMKLSVLCAMRKLSGKGWEEFGKWLDEEFLPKRK